MPAACSPGAERRRTGPDQDQFCLLRDDEELPEVIYSFIQQRSGALCWVLGAGLMGMNQVETVLTSAFHFSVEPALPPTGKREESPAAHWCS